MNDKAVYKCSAFRDLKCCKGTVLMMGKVGARCYPNRYRTVSGYSVCGPKRTLAPKCSSYKNDNAVYKCSAFRRIKCCKGMTLMMGKFGARCYPYR